MLLSQKEKTQEGGMKLLEVMGGCIYDIYSDGGFKVRSYLQTHQVVNIKYLQLFVC